MKDKEVLNQIDIWLSDDDLIRDLGYEVVDKLIEVKAAIESYKIHRRIVSAILKRVNEEEDQA